MLSTIYAAEILFRHESAARAREQALLASIRSRHHARTIAERAAVRPVDALIAAPSRAKARAPRPTWPRPIGIEHREAAACCPA